MTAQANFVTVRNGHCRIAHHNTGAYEIMEVSALGPHVTGRFLDAWQELDPSDQWNDERCSEGGLLVDYDAKVLIVFTIYRSRAMRAAYLASMPRVWPGWEIRWAYNGVADLIAHVGGDVAGWRTPRGGPEQLYSEARPEGSTAPQYLVTVGTSTAYGLWDCTVDPWWAGPDLLSSLCDDDRVEGTFSAPTAGIHLDPDRRVAGIWTTGCPLYGIADAWPELWPGWTLELWGDDYSSQLRACPRVSFTDVDLDRGTASLVEHVTATWAFYVVEDFAANCAETFGGKPQLLAVQREMGWFRTLERSGVTRIDMSTALKAIIGPGSRTLPVPPGL
ncbi:hypothetical protein AB0M47_20255 [Hamadaea sp. NPDC051192]|uniref:hypothetical protein n=1 Tax=Hamadaea sp. NPDC051192 TaxID=3154940 RepID=UPI00341B80CF